jgi:hypothetical protein
VLRQPCQSIHCLLPVCLHLSVWCPLWQ